MFHQTTVFFNLGKVVGLSEHVIITEGSRSNMTRVMK